MNTAIFENLIRNYNELSYTHNYIFGYSENGTVYYAYADASVLPYVCTLDHASRGCGSALRFRPNREQKSFMRTLETYVLCSKEYFDTCVANSKYNAGEIFEKLITETCFGQTWVKDNIPFTKAGDIEANGIAYQIKYEKATFINEKTLQKMRAH